MIDPLIRNLQADIALLQTYIIRRQSAGFYDMERMLEGLTIHLFKALQLGNLTNKNQLKVNFPAIDLADDNRNVAVQVTSNASPAKIRKTVAAFEKKNSKDVSLNDKYSMLYIFGFCKSSVIPIPNYCRVINPDFIIGELCDKADEDQIQDVLNAVRRHRSYSSLHPWDDKDSLEIILNTVNRNAVKHMMFCEGSISKMTEGLNEISELIGKGTVKGKEKSKSICDFQDVRIVSFLRNIMDDISTIVAIVNKSRIGSGDFFAIDYEGMGSIDRLKQKIALDSSKIAKIYAVPIEIQLKY